MKKKQSDSQRGYVNPNAPNHRPMLYVDVADGIFRSSIGGDEVPVEGIRKIRFCVKPQQKLAPSTLQSRSLRGGIPLAKAKDLSATIAKKTGLCIPVNIIRGTLGGVYPPLGIVKNGAVIETIKSLK